MNVSMFYVWEMLIIAIGGFVFRRLGYVLPSLIMGLVLGGVVETNIHLTHTFYKRVSIIWRRPAASVIFVLAITVLVFNLLSRRKLSRLGKRTPSQLKEVLGKKRIFIES